MSHWHTLPGRDLKTYEVPTPNHYSKRDRFEFCPHFSFVRILIVYYRIYALDGAIPSKTPATPSDPFLGRIKARSVPPPHRDTAQAVKFSIAKVENIEDRANARLFLTPYSQLPMGDADKVTALNRTTGPGSTPQEPLAFVANILESALESGGRGGLENAAEPDTTPDLEIRYRTSIHSTLSYFFFVLNISTTGGSVLSTLRRQL